MALAVPMLCKDNDARTLMLKTDTPNQFLCIPCVVHVNANESLNHQTSDRHRKAINVMHKIDDKLAQLALTRKDIIDAAQGKQVPVPMVKKMDDLDKKAQTYFFRIDQMEQKINGVADDMQLESHYGHRAVQDIKRLRSEKATKKQIGDLMKNADTADDKIELLEKKVRASELNKKHIWYTPTNTLCYAPAPY
jgi:hypothetical protein